MAGESADDPCPRCGAQLIKILETDTSQLERVQCIGIPSHEFSVFVQEGTDPPLYVLGPENKPQRD